MIVRISTGTFSPERAAEAGAALRERSRPCPASSTTTWCADRERGQLTNVSVWDSLEHATAMSQLPEMLAQRPVMEAAGVTFEVITNHAALWSITP